MPRPAVPCRHRAGPVAGPPQSVRVAAPNKHVGDLPGRSGHAGPRSCRGIHCAERARRCRERGRVPGRRRGRGAGGRTGEQPDPGGRLIRDRRGAAAAEGARHLDVRRVRQDRAPRRAGARRRHRRSCRRCAAVPPPAARRGRARDRGRPVDRGHRHARRGLRLGLAAAAARCGRGSCRAGARRATPASLGGRVSTRAARPDRRRTTGRRGRGGPVPEARPSALLPDRGGRRSQRGGHRDRGTRGERAGSERGSRGDCGCPSRGRGWPCPTARSSTYPA